MMMAKDNVVEFAEFNVDPTQENDVAKTEVELVREMRKNRFNNNGSKKDVGGTFQQANAKANIERKETCL